MPDSLPSSTASADCRIEWRPSRLLVSALVSLSLTAAGCVLASAVPSPSQVPLAALVAILGLVGARREAAVPACAIVWPGGDAPAMLMRGGTVTALHAVRIERRGVLVRMQGRDHRGVMQRLLWWPDTLDAGTRRRLALAMGAGGRHDNRAASMAA